MLGAIYNGLTGFFSIISSAFHYMVSGFAFVWSAVGYAFSCLTSLPIWISGFCMVCLILAVFKLVLNR